VNIDGKTFLILVTTLAAGGGLGYLGSEKHILPPLEPKKEPPPPPPPAPPPPPPPAATPDAAPVAPPAPVCDDTAGTPGDCPPLGLPTVEGGCGSFANFRCTEMKQAVKPRVAQAATTCLSKLTPGERCDAKRVNLCVHTALMSACPDTTSTTDTCKQIVQACASAAAPPSQADCERTLAGMNQAGRDRTIACVKKHCADRGFLWCEAVNEPTN
jgi:hypothetical protein